MSAWLTDIALAWGGGFNVYEGDVVAFNNSKGSSDWTSTLSSGDNEVSDSFALGKFNGCSLLSCGSCGPLRMDLGTALDLLSSWSLSDECSIPHHRDNVYLSETFPTSLTSAFSFYF